MHDQLFIEDTNCNPPLGMTGGGFFFVIPRLILSIYNSCVRDLCMFHHNFEIIIIIKAKNSFVN